MSMALLPLGVELEGWLDGSTSVSWYPFPTAEYVLNHVKESSPFMQRRVELSKN